MAPLLTRIANSFDELADSSKHAHSSKSGLEILQLVSACRLVATLLGHFGSAFTLAQEEFKNKIDALEKASQSIPTLDALIDQDKGRGRPKNEWNNSRDLVRVKRSIAMLGVIFEKILEKSEDSLKGPVTKAYEKILAPYHGGIVQTGARLSTWFNELPKKKALLKELGETEASAKVQMEKFVKASSVVINYIEDLFHSRKSAEVLKFKETITIFGIEI